jgi:hypothetical protein
LNESSQGAVVGSFNIIGEKAGGQFLMAPVIFKAFTANSFAAAGFPGAIASLQVLFALTFLHVRLRGSL